MWISDKWKDYEILDASDGEKLERWGDYILIRPDPQIIWKTPKASPDWDKTNAKYNRSSKGGGSWEFYDLPEQWQISYDDLVFNIKPMNFKHTGIFPEQAANWDYFRGKILDAGRKIKVLNLFAYTGGATVACAKAGAEVCHVDAARGMVTWARENAKTSGLENAPIRYIVDDCMKFVEREIRRGNKYDAVIMDPPSYGRGPGGEVWKIEDHVYALVQKCMEVLGDNPLFFVLNSYTTGLSASTMKYIVGTLLTRRFGGKCEANELGIKVKSTGFALPMGASARWEL